MHFRLKNASRLLATAAGLICVAICLAGCGRTDATAGKPAAKGSATPRKPKKLIAGSSEPAEQKPKSKFEAVTLGGGSDASGGSGGTEASADKLMDSVVQAMKPLQIMLGKWRGTTSQKVKGFASVEELEWIWDFRTSRAQPALVVKSDKSPYIRDGRLTFLTEKQTYQLTATSPEGEKHVLEGKFESEPDEFTGDDNKPQRTYKLVLTEQEPTGDDAWRVAFDQQENNRYLVQLSRRRGAGSFHLVDTVGTQRVGTSFAISDDDYGDKKCIISGGLGTSTVTYNGKTYWVCCSGCQAAFNEDPKRWVAKMEEAEKKKAEK